LVKELQQSKSVLAQQVIISSTTVEYPDKVKVISIFAPEPSATELTQVTSIFDKLTASIRVIETSQTTISSIQSGSSTERQIFTNTEIHSA
jgi:phosphopantothenoylcysteine synthetase/decarboxylase